MPFMQPLAEGDLWFLLSQLVPFRKNPSLQMHVNEPSLSSQTALAPQGSGVHAPSGEETRRVNGICNF